MRLEKQLISGWMGECSQYFKGGVRLGYLRSHTEQIICMWKKTVGTQNLSGLSFTIAHHPSRTSCEWVYLLQ